MESIAVSVQNVSKKFRLFNSPKERLLEVLHPFKKKYHREFWALTDINLEVEKGTTVGIIGRNGSGKSTLLQIICSILRPTSGIVATNGRISSLLTLGAGFSPEFTGRNNVLMNGALMGFSREEMKQRLPVIEAFADIGEFIDQPVKIYSSGMFVRLAFATAINVDPDILVIDEVLAVGDEKFQHKCYGKFLEFQKSGKTILFVSHNTDIIVKHCDYAILLENGFLLKEGAPADMVNSYHELLYGKPFQETSDSGFTINSEMVGLKAISTEHTSGKTFDNDDLFSFIKMDKGSDDRCAGRPSYNNAETRIGDRRALIVDYALVANGAELDPPTIKYGSQISLYLNILFRADIEDMIVGFALLSLDKSYVYHTNTELQQLTPLSGHAGDFIIVKFLWKACFVGGHYFLNIGCHLSRGNDHKYLDVRRSMAHLHFSETAWCGGLVALPANFTVCYRGGVKEKKSTSIAF